MNTTSKQSYEVVVVGAGVIGLVTAWRAAQRGMRVVLIEAERPAAGATGVAAGMLAPVTEADFGEEKLIELNLQGARPYPEFVAELEQEAGAKTAYRRCGTVSVAVDRDQLVVLRRLHELQRELGLAAEWLGGREARALEPMLAPRVTGGIFAPEDHQISPRALAAALCTAFERAGGVLRVGEPVRSVLFDSERVTGVELRCGERIGAAYVVLAAGSWSARLAPGECPPLRPVKGQTLRLRSTRAQPVPAHVVRTPEFYAVPRADGRLVVGATVEERGFERSVTAGAVLGLLERAYEALPGVAELELVETSAGLRPTTPDNAPIVGAGDLEGLIWATGHWRNGILLAPITAEAVVELLVGAAMADVFVPFSPRRFALTGEAVL